MYMISSLRPCALEQSAGFSNPLYPQPHPIVRTILRSCRGRTCRLWVALGLGDPRDRTWGRWPEVGPGVHSLPGGRWCRSRWRDSPSSRCRRRLLFWWTTPPTLWSVTVLLQRNVKLIIFAPFKFAQTQFLEICTLLNSRTYHFEYLIIIIPYDILV